MVGVNWEACLPSRHIFQGLPARTHPRGGADPSGPVARDSATVVTLRALALPAALSRVTGQPCWALGGVAVGEAVGVLTLQRPWQVSGRGRGRPIHSYHLQVGYFVCHIMCGTMHVLCCTDTHLTVWCAAMRLSTILICWIFLPGSQSLDTRDIRDNRNNGTQTSHMDHQMGNP